MTQTIHTHVDPYFETFGLLVYSNCLDIDILKNSYIEEFNHLGLSGQAIYDTHFLSWEQVITQFQKQCKQEKLYDFFFSETTLNDELFCSFLMILMMDYRDHLQTATTENELKELLLSALVELDHSQEQPAIHSTDELLHYLSTLELSESGKWKFLTLYHEPSLYSKSFLDLIDANIPVMTHVYETIAMDGWIDQYYQLFTGAISMETIKIIEVPQKGLQVYPTFVHPLSQIASETKYFFGLLNYEVFQNSSTPAVDESLLMKLKALSDKSKFQILLSLKREPKYNSQLAEELGLSAGTISHHMSVLLGIGLVGVEKQASKVYYVLDTNVLNQLLSQLSSLLV